MIWLVMLFVSAACVLIQAAVAPFPVLGGAKIPLLLAVVIYYSLNHDTGSAAVSALLCGFLNDSMSFIPIGQTSMVFFFVALVASRFRRVVHGDEILPTSLFGAVSAAVCVFLGYRLLLRANLVTVPALLLWHKAFGSFVLGLIATPFVCLFIKRMDSLVGNVATTEVIEDVLD